MKSNHLSQSINSTKFFLSRHALFRGFLVRFRIFSFLEATDRVHDRSLPLGGDHAGNPRIPGCLAELVCIFIHLFFFEEM